MSAIAHAAQSLYCGLAISPRRICICIATILSLLLAVANAQFISVGDDTSTPIEGAGHDYIKALVETVNPANGSLSIRIQASPAKGRGITLPFSFGYDSNGVNHVVPQGYYISALSDQAYASQGGWTYSVPSITASRWSSSVNTNNGTVTCTFSSGYTFQDPSGGRHNLGLAAASWASNGQYICSNPTIGGGDQQYGAALVTTANAGNYNPPVQVTDADGTVYYFSNPERYTYASPQSIIYGSLPDYIEDRNGNQITIAPGSANGSFTVTDSVGRHAVVSTGIGPSGSTNTITVAGMTFKVAWTTTHPNYTPPNVLVYALQGDTCTTMPSITAPETAVSSITLPNLQQYQFYYGDNNPNGYSNPYGLLSEIDYPTGAWVRYTWKPSDTYSEAIVTDSQGGGSTNPEGCQFEIKTPVIATRSVGLKGSSTPILTQTFSYNTSWNADSGSGPTWSNPKQTTETTVDNVRGLTSLTTYAYSSYYLPLPSNNPYLPDFVAAQIPVESSVQYYNWGNTTSPIRTVNKSWYDQYDLASETTQQAGKTSKITYCYVGTNCVPNTGFFSQLQEEDEYDFGASTPSRKTVTTYQSFTGTVGIIASKPCKTVVYDGTGNQYAETDYYYDGGTSLCGAAGTQATSPVSGLVAGTHDETHYGSSSTTPRGNVTKKAAQISSSASAVTTLSYDETGQVTAVTDPCGNPSGTCTDMTGSNHTTTYLYANIAPDGSSNFTTLSSGTNVSYTPSGTVNAYLTEITDALGHTTNFKYDFNTGQLTQSTDGNGQVVTYLYYDSLARPTLVTYPDGGQTEYMYNDAAPSPSVTTCQNIDGTAGAVCSASTPSSGWKTGTAIMDGMGHVVQTQLLSDLLGTDFTDTSYDGEGRVLSRSNPHRSTSLSSDGTIKYLYDALGRPTQTTNADGSITTTIYDQTNPSSTGVCTTITDEAGNSRQSCADGLGRVTGVWEDPGAAPHLNYQTTYAYDPLNNLLSVSQNGSDSSTARNRSFTYDNLSRLLCAANPEIQPVTCPTSGTSFPAGAVTYIYDVNGNLVHKKSPLPNQTAITSQVTANYAYDVLNRPTQKSYTGMTGQPVIRFGYDGVLPSGCTPTSITNTTNLIGRRSSMCDGVGSAAWSYDPMGRTEREQHAIHGITKAFTYLYLVDGEVYSLDYPDGKSVSFSPYGNGLTDGVEDDIFSFQGSHDFAPNGSPYAVDYGPSTNASAASQTFYYNERFQSAEMYLFDTTDFVANYCYDFHVAGGQTVGDTNQFCTFSATSPADNGNLYQSMNNLDATGNRTANYAYDSLNRIQQAYTTGPKWGEAYVIDAWGNLTNRNPVSGKTNHEPLAAPALATNHLTGFTYDAAGNLIIDGTNTYTYDAENRLITAGGVTYSYDGDGNRVTKSNGTIYWRGSDGETLAESNLTGTVSEEYVYINGQREIRMDRPSGAIHLYFTDLVGSTTLITDVNGTPQEQTDYYPFGGEIAISGSDPNHYKFTGKERDSESGLDNFGARHYASTVGRFMSTDRYNAMLTRHNLEVGGLPSEAADAYLDGYLENPQNWNQYAYVRNNPLRLVDPTGAAPVDGHHLIISRNVLTGVARDFANSIKTGPLSGNGFPNQPGFNAMHREYNAAVEEALEQAEQTMGDRNTWSASQWKDIANQILNSQVPAIRNFLDELEANNPGAKAALGAAITAYRVSTLFLARAIAAALGSAIVRLPLIIYVDVQSAFRHPDQEADRLPPHPRCLKTRDGRCVD